MLNAIRKGLINLASMVTGVLPAANMTLTNLALVTPNIGVATGTSLALGGALNLVTTSTDGSVVQNTTAATVGVPVQISPRHRISGTGWDTDDTVSRAVSFFTEVLPTSAAAISGTWKLGFVDPVTSAITYPLTVHSAGSVTALGSVSLGGGTAGFIAGAGGALAWSARSIMRSPANGQINFTNAAENAGTGIDVLTDAILKIRTRAQTGYATVDALAYRVSGAAASGAFLRGDGTSFIASTLLLPDAAVNGGAVYSTATALAITAAGTSGQLLTSNGAAAPTWEDPPAGAGTVTSVAMTVPTGLSVSGSPVTTSGTLAVALASGYMIPGGGSAGQVLQSAGASAPVFSTATYPATITSGHVLVASGANVIAGQAPAAFTKTDDTNVTATLGGSATTALINAMSLTLGWVGQLAGSRGGTGYSSLKAAGIAYSMINGYISGTGTAGADNTAQTVKTIVIPANTLTQVGDRIIISFYLQPDTGTAVVVTLTVNGVSCVSFSTGTGTATMTRDVILEYLDATHANITTTPGAAPNMAGFDWTVDQDIDVDQSAVSNNHITVFSIVGMVYPKGVVAA